MLTLADAMLLVIRGRRKHLKVRGLAGDAVELYHDLMRLGDYRPELAHIIVDYYLGGCND